MLVFYPQTLSPEPLPLADGTSVVWRECARRSFPIGDDVHPEGRFLDPDVSISILFPKIVGDRASGMTENGKLT